MERIGKQRYKTATSSICDIIDGKKSETFSERGKMDVQSVWRYEALITKCPPAAEVMPLQKLGIPVQNSLEMWKGLSLLC